MASDFDRWVPSIELHEPDDPPDATLPAGTAELLRETFDVRGPVSRSEFDRAWDERQEELARYAVDLVLADLHGTTPLRPTIKIWWHENGQLVIAYNGGYSTPAIWSLRNPEVLQEAAAYLQGEVMMELWSPWPICPTDGAGLDPAVVAGQAVWRCRDDDHVISTIGQLAPRSD